MLLAFKTVIFIYSFQFYIVDWYCTDIFDYLVANYDQQRIGNFGQHNCWELINENNIFVT